VADDSQIEVWANLLGSQLLIGLRLSDRSMRHRFKKKVDLPASLRPSLAAAMVYLSQPEPTDTFLDPLCGSGTILLERMAYGPYGQILGGDLVTDRVDAARRNLPKTRKGKKKENVDIRQWDAQNLPIDNGSVDKLVTNLPFGKQIAAGVNLEKLYASLFAEFERVVRPGGRIIILSSQYDLVKSCLRRRPFLTIDTGYSISTLGRWGRIYIINRQP
jgi:23S rRNA G2445 N2-methylase RlmL